MVVYSRNVPLMCLTWFYSLSPHSLYNFEEVIKPFLTQYTSYREAKRNNRYLLTIKKRQGNNLKSYIGCFQSQLAKVSDCNEDISAITFISELQVSHPMYKHLLKHNVTRMSEILS